MKGFVVACVAAACIVAAVAVNPECDPSYECAYTYVESDLSDKYTFDFSTLCSSTDYVLTDAAEHTYYANICGTAKQNCLPGTCLRCGSGVGSWMCVPSVSVPSVSAAQWPCAARASKCLVRVFQKPDGCLCFHSIMEEHVHERRCCADLGCRPDVQQGRPSVPDRDWGCFVLHGRLPGARHWPAAVVPA